MTEPAPSKESIEPRLARAQHLIELGRTEQALALLLDLLAEDPDNGYVVTLAAGATLDLDRLDEAEGWARRAAYLNPGEEWPWRLHAIALSRQGRPTEAIAAARTAVRLEPEGWRTHVVLAEVLRERPGGFEEAWDEGNRACALAPDEAAVHALMGGLAMQANALWLAEPALRNALRLDPSNASALTDLGRLQLIRHDHVQAARQFADAGRRDIHSTVAEHNVDVALTSAAARAFFLAVAILAAARVSLDFATDRSVVLAGLVTLALLLGVVTWQAMVLRRLLGGGARGYVRSLPWRNRSLTLAVALTLLALSLAALTCILPIGWRWPFLIAGIASLAAARVALAVAKRRFRVGAARPSRGRP